MRERSRQNQPIGFMEQFQIPAVRNYIFVGLAALLVCFVVMTEFQRSNLREPPPPRNDLGALLVILAAIPGLLFRWVASPILSLFFLTYTLFDPDFHGLKDWFGGSVRGWYYSAYPYRGGLKFDDILLSASFLIYLMAHYRIMSFVHKSMPDDPAPRRKGQPEPEIPRRPFRLFAERELGVLLGMALGCIIFSAILWMFIADYESGSRFGGSWGISRPVARFMVFLWSVGAGAVMVGVVFRYLAMRGMSWFEARVIVQDLFWLETRREQERIYRWRLWFGKRATASKAKGDK